jgi:hypothetical protein
MKRTILRSPALAATFCAATAKADFTFTLGTG